MKLNLAIAQHVEKLPLPRQSEVLDYVLYLEQKTANLSISDSERSKQLTAALKKVVDMNPYAKIDPIAWLQEQRIERSLPGRD
ncbi:MAG: DUF2281 domain-containing protein [Proteobacteria bacterium]|nr:DUF2281 domain-containing protein [Pseudomonadota bacterium]